MLMNYALLLLALLLLALLALAYWISSLLLYSRRQPVAHTPGDYGLIYENIAFHSSDGLSLKGWWIPARRDSPMQERAPAVILLHPMFGNRHGFSPQPKSRSRQLRTEVDLLKMACCFHQAGYHVLLFDFRSHGESQGGRCSGGLTENQDVVGAVDYVFGRLAGQSASRPASRSAAENPAKAPQVGLVGFGLGAVAAIAAIGREKGRAETIRVFSGDSEGGVGWTEIQPANVKKLRFLVAVQPASLGVLLRGCLRQRIALLDRVLVPLVDRLCQWRGGYPLGGGYLLKYTGELHVPVLYIQRRPDLQGERANESDSGEVQKLFDATPGPKQLCWIDPPLARLETYAYLCDHPESILPFADLQVSRQPSGL